MSIDFLSPEEKKWFEDLLCAEGQSLEIYSDLFDSRSKREKKNEYKRLKEELKVKLVQQYGLNCQLAFPEKCTSITDESQIEIDHIIPLDSNTLNKKLHKIPRPFPKKVPQQSFGSNSLLNLVVACPACNGHKMNNLLSKEDYRRLLATKGF